MQSINTQTGRKFPNRVYRALAGYVVGEAISLVTDEEDKVMFTLALRNAMKAKTDDADGIIRKTIDPRCFSVVENYWKKNIPIASLEGKDVVTTIFDTKTWAGTGLEIEDVFGDIQSLAKFYNREQFKKGMTCRKASDSQDIFVFANQVANEIAAQDWLFTAENPIETLKGLGLKGPVLRLGKIKSRIRENQKTAIDGIESVSVYRRYLFANDYADLGLHRISPLNFSIAIFYELLYERLKSENYG